MKLFCSIHRMIGNRLQPAAEHTQLLPPPRRRLAHLGPSTIASTGQASWQKPQ